MPYLITSLDGDDIEVIGVGKLIFKSDYPSDGFSLVKDAKITCVNGYQKISMSYDFFLELFDVKDLPIAHFNEISNHLMLRVKREDGRVFTLIYSILVFTSIE